MVDDTACAGTADKTILAPTLTFPVATQATRLKTILPERVATFQAAKRKRKTENWIRRFHRFSQMGRRVFTAEVAGVRRGGGRRIGRVSGATCWLAQQCFSIGTPWSRLRLRSSHLSRAIKIKWEQAEYSGHSWVNVPVHTAMLEEAARGAK